MSPLRTFHIHIKGIVQGVGFRPFIYKLFVFHKLKGWVNNTTDGVHIQFNTTKEFSDEILYIIQEESPKLAVITSISLVEVGFLNYLDFKIVQSAFKERTTQLLTPDYAMCEDCSKELNAKENKRYQYPFITCTNCGPRFSIIRSLPYDRITTTMDNFIMCDSCNKEYENPMDRRYFSQTNSCPKCAIKLALYENGKLQDNFTDLDYIVKQWEKGKIVAIKGIGGYILTCDATNADVIKRLRKLKNRPTKPLALLYHDIYELAEDVEMGIGEKIELEEPSSPIVLLHIKKDRMTPIALDEIAPNLNHIGVMMPYTPLYKLLLDKFKKPVVATSGNISNSTIIYQDEKAIKELSKISDLILLNNRQIVVPQDDSVISHSFIKYYRTVIRRSRGLAPSYINPDLILPKKSVLAMGAMLKSSFTLLNHQNIYISQYLGNTENFEAENNYKKTLSHFEDLFQPKLDIVLTDKHPNYFTTVFGKDIADKKNIRSIGIQHHKAHFFAVLGENALFNSKDKILGVVWDGTGLGDDGNIWGGEFFTYQQGKTERIHHMDEFPFILGDKMPKEPRISAFVMTSHLENNKIIKDKFTKTEWQIYQTLVKNTTLKSTSIGRIFDAAASIILDIDKQTYEGEAAMQLESAAHRYFRTNNFTKFYSYLKSNEIPKNFVEYLIKNMISDIGKGYEKDFIAAKFHISLAHYISIVAGQIKAKKVAFSGGVFQNQLLIELLISFMDDDFELYFHKELSPNDENISFGQLMYYIYNQD
ncbi:MAG: carbamoyltransferase HypF [Flavobacteriaceae bacterium]|nr:carbamoyltransferase HypF [Flavobacteriaceae bacterium]